MNRWIDLWGIDELFFFAPGSRLKLYATLRRPRSANRSREEGSETNEQNGVLVTTTRLKAPPRISTRTSIGISLGSAGNKGPDKKAVDRKWRVQSRGPLCDTFPHWF
ncbi:hypothetical protein CC2G_009927 [Coprinopsis cinerea AmutBmut pab1-1]|nr:hypothetical protein CC2G_009927 [Coprinopsis cinerea AmutBmut pab1-1]